MASPVVLENRLEAKKGLFPGGARLLSQHVCKGREVLNTASEPAQETDLGALGMEICRTQ